MRHNYVTTLEERRVECRKRPDCQRRLNKRQGTLRNVGRTELDDVDVAVCVSDDRHHGGWVLKAHLFTGLAFVNFIGFLENLKKTNKQKNCRVSHQSLGISAFYYKKSWYLSFPFSKIFIKFSTNFNPLLADSPHFLANKFEHVGRRGGGIATSLYSEAKLTFLKVEHDQTNSCK